MIAIKDSQIVDVKDDKHRVRLEKQGYSIYEVTRSKDGAFKRGRLLSAPCKA